MRGSRIFSALGPARKRVAALLGFAALVTSCQVAQAPAPTALPDEARVASACRVVSVVDGDTVEMACAGGGAFRARLTGYDTPESHEPGCAAEARAGRQATQRLNALLAGARSVEPRFGGIDRYGRHLVRLTVDGRDVGAILIAEGLAVPYSGGRRIDWCARLT
jgi:micrococcal nuclease